MTQTTVIEGRLSEAWAFLCGESCAFTQVAPPTSAPPGADDSAALLPIRIDDAVVGACRVVISDEQARQVAGFLFGVEASELSPADLRDAVLEACNVLGSCVAQSIPTPHPVRIGCPEPDGSLAEGLSTRTQFRAEDRPEPRLDLLARAPLVDGEDAQP